MAHVRGTFERQRRFRRCLAPEDHGRVTVRRRLRREAAIDKLESTS